MSRTLNLFWVLSATAAVVVASCILHCSDSSTTPVSPGLHLGRFVRDSCSVRDYAVVGLTYSERYRIELADPLRPLARQLVVGDRTFQFGDSLAWWYPIESDTAIDSLTSLLLDYTGVVVDRMKTPVRIRGGFQNPHFPAPLAYSFVKRTRAWETGLFQPETLYTASHGVVTIALLDVVPTDSSVTYRYITIAEEERDSCSGNAIGWVRDSCPPLRDTLVDTIMVTMVDEAIRTEVWQMPPFFLSSLGLDGGVYENSANKSRRTSLDSIGNTLVRTTEMSTSWIYSSRNGLFLLLVQRAESGSGVTEGVVVNRDSRYNGIGARIDSSIVEYVRLPR